eukprot:6206562-Pleurochrysis_carterae.AAC.2
MCPTWSVQNIQALDSAHAADNSCPFESARQAVVSRRSAARANAEPCGCVFREVNRLPESSGVRVAAAGAKRTGALGAVLHRVSTRDNSRRFEGLCWRVRRVVARGSLEACNRCMGTQGARTVRSVGTRRHKDEHAAVSPILWESCTGSYAPWSQSCFAPIAATAPSAATLSRIEASAHIDRWFGRDSRDFV